MLFSEHPEVAREVMAAAERRDRAGYVSKGNAVVQIKELTLCLNAAWLRRQAGHKARAEPDTLGQTRINLGVAFDRWLPAAEVGQERLELLLPAGIASGRLDLRIEGDPAEVKTTWAYPEKKGEEVELKPQYVEQLAGYLLADGWKKQGWLLILHAARPVFRAFRVGFGDNELAAFYEELARRADLVTGPTMPGMAEHYDWEPRYCSETPCPCSGTGGKQFGFFSGEQFHGLH